MTVEEHQAYLIEFLESLQGRNPEVIVNLIYRYFKLHDLNGKIVITNGTEITLEF